MESVGKGGWIEVDRGCDSCLLFESGRSDCLDVLFQLTVGRGLTKIGEILEKSILSRLG
jgi:hypothetical protein